MRASFPPSILSLVFRLCILRELWRVPTANALTNVPVDAQDSRIVYTPSSSWTWINGTTLDAGGGHMLAQNDPTATATITLPFVSVYFMSTLWPYPVKDNLAIDGDSPITLDLRDYSVPDRVQGNGTVASSIVAWYEGTESAEHTIVVSVPPGEQYTIVDMFIFTVLDTSDPTPTVTAVDSTSTVNSPGVTGTGTIHFSTGSPTGGPASTGTSRPGKEFDDDSDKAHHLAIAMAVVGTVLGLLLLAALWWLYERHRRRQRETVGSIKSPTPPIVPPSIVGGDAQGGRDTNDGNGDDGYDPYEHLIPGQDGQTPTKYPMSQAGLGLGLIQSPDASSQRNSYRQSMYDGAYDGSTTMYPPPQAQRLVQQPTSSSLWGPSSSRNSQLQRGDGLSSAAQIIVNNPPPTHLADTGTGYYSPPMADAASSNSPFDSAFGYSEASVTPRASTSKKRSSNFKGSG